MVFGRRGLDGVKVAVVPVHVTVPVIKVGTTLSTGVPCIRVKANPVIVRQSIASLNVTVMALLISAQVPRLTGLVETTVGGPLVVKLTIKLLANALPAVSFASVVIVAV